MDFNKENINMVDAKKAKKTVVATGIGNAMEWFDFGVYAIQLRTLERTSSLQ